MAKDGPSALATRRSLATVTTVVWVGRDQKSDGAAGVDGSRKGGVFASWGCRSK